jgi:putative membrane protein
MLLVLHPGGPPHSGQLWSAWNLEPFVMAGLLAATLIYARGLRAVRRRGGSRTLPRWRAASFGAGIAVLAVALISPLDALGEALFSAHMVQHLALMLLAAPLLVLGSPVYVAVFALPRSWRANKRDGAGTARRALRTVFAALARAVPHPLVAFLLQAIALAFWHVPSFYQAAVNSETVHAVQHTTYFATALLFWAALLDPARRLRLAYGAGMLYVFAASMQAGVLGALLAFSTRPWYTSHVRSAPEWGFTALEDQQVAGAIMWVPGGLIYVLALAALMLLWLRSAEARVHALERSGRVASHRA